MCCELVQLGKIGQRLWSCLLPLFDENTSIKLAGFVGVILKFLAVTCLILSGVVTNAQAIDIGKISGHEISLTEQDYERILKVDGREMHRNAIILFYEVTTVAGIPIIVGSSSAGGNACDGSPFVISFPEDGKPRLDGPIDSCASVSYKIDQGKVVFLSPNIPGKGQDKWEWTAIEGMKSSGTIAYKATDTSGWNALREQSIQYPWDAFNNVEISGQIKQLLGPDLDKFQGILTGIATGSYQNGDFIGHACTPHSCTVEEAIIFLSYADKKVYAAFKPDGQKIKVFPIVKEWPEKAKSELRSWSKKWK